jgi:hypothetical protein
VVLQVIAVEQGDGIHPRLGDLVENVAAGAAQPMIAIRWPRNLRLSCASPDLDEAVSR